MSIENSKVINDCVFLMTNQPNEETNDSLHTISLWDTFLHFQFKFCEFFAKYMMIVSPQSVCVFQWRLYPDRKLKKGIFIVDGVCDIRSFYRLEKMCSIVGMGFFGKHTLMKINNKSFPLFLESTACLIPAIIFYGFSHTPMSNSSIQRNFFFLWMHSLHPWPK